MRLEGLSKTLAELDGFGELTNCIAHGQTPVNVIGVSGLSSAHLIFCACRNLSKKAIVVTPDGVAANKLLADLQAFYGDGAMLLPERELIFYDIDAQAKDVLSHRLTTLQRLYENDAPIVVTTISALLGFCAPREAFDAALRFEDGGRVSLPTLADSFVMLGYVREDIVEGRGQFAIRGGIVDFFPHTAQNPVRVELFDDEIDSIREFDVISQRSLGKLTRASATPSDEIFISNERRGELVGFLEAEAYKREGAVGDTLRRDAERLENRIRFPSMDRYIPFVFERIPTVLDYAGDDTLFFICEPGNISQSAEASGVQLAEQVAAFAEKGMVIQSKKQWCNDYHDALRVLSKNLIGLSGIAHTCPDYRPRQVIAISAKSQTGFHGKLDLFYDAMRFYRNSGYAVVILGGSEGKAKNIARALEDEEIFAVYRETVTEPPEPKQIIVTHGEISQGAEYPAIKLAIIGDKEVFGHDRKPRRQPRRKAGERLDSFTDLSVGDYVVHQDHGIGQFTGIKEMSIDGATADYLHIQFRGKDSLYVPTNQLDLVYKYIGKESETVKLSKLGGTQWQTTKQKVRQSAVDMARQLIELYAVRENVKGHAFTPDGDWHAGFAATFPYEETDDQLTSIDEVRRDMEKDRPMDRLLCGDVGYGKTEIALRAAFKAVMDGFQVAYLVPTTILASQHYTTFAERMKEFPVKVEMLSRFRTAKQQQETIKRAKAGEVDIIIGTHRIIQKDLNFKNLGLLIIDEEQRFGVAHKEQLKQIRQHVDVLTLTATPIPRTLHMSMTGIRDISVLENPPKDRYPVSTYVLEYNDEIIREGIMREVARGGQVYYLHNRVQTIDKVAARISALSPDLRVVVAHGQMSVHELEDIMQQVIDRQVDVLVCTTIIETGLDIPNVNTIIVEEADQMGLAQLYQLRGRVGRSNRLAYAYLTYRRDRVLSETAQKRLKAIREFTEFGSGFKIALRDLEIRGAGNVIGTQQHGHMEAVGYDMYCKLLAEAVLLLKGQELPTQVQTSVTLSVDAFIPKDYIKGENYRIEIYKRIASIENAQDALDVYDEIQDRYGDLPQTVANLLDISLIRSLAMSLDIEEVKSTGTGVVFVFARGGEPDFRVVSDLMKQYDNRLLYSAGAKPYLTLRCQGKDLLANVKNVLQDYKQLKNP